MGGGGRFRRVQLAGLLAAALTFASLHHPASATSTASTDETAFLAGANALRAATGLPPLVLDAGLSSFARDWSAVMAGAGDVWHNPDLAAALGALPPQSTLRENVGMGPGVAVVQQALAASPSHRANMVNPQATRVGIGVIRVGAVVYVTQNFVERPGMGARTVAAPAGPASSRSQARDALPASRTTATPRLRLVLDQLRALGV